MCILAYSSRVSCVFAAYSSAYSRVFAAYLPRILRIRRVFSRIRCVFAYGAGYMSPQRGELDEAYSAASFLLDWDWLVVGDELAELGYLK